MPARPIDPADQFKREAIPMPRTSRPITVTLGDLQERVAARVESGAYASASEVIRAAVRALDREEAAITDWLRRRVDEAFADPRPNRPARTVFKRLRQHHAEQVKAGRNYEPALRGTTEE
jgi:antitoxin ParD1/3/4